MPHFESTDGRAGPQHRLWPVVSFTALYLALATVGALVTGNREFVFYIVVMLALVVAIGLVYLRVRFTTSLLWALSIWGLAHMAGGLVPVPESWPIDGQIRVLYSWWLVPDRLKYDHVVHAYGFGVTTVACWQALQVALASAANKPAVEVHPTFGTLVLCAAGAMGFGAMNEVVEFAATLAVPETNVGGYVNTGWDLVSNMTGAMLAAVAIWIASSRD
jgi:energy-coupling factor transporter transmembrane protein EcfT